MSDYLILAGFLKMELPGGAVLLCDGGTLTFDGEIYSSEDATFGSIAGFDPIAEGLGDEAPAGTMTFVPQPAATVSEICDAAMQGSRIRMWIAEVDAETGLIAGTPNQMLDAVVDVPTLKLGRGERMVDIDFASALERVFIINRGNVLSGEFHRRVYPSEHGLDNAVAVSTTFAWGVNAAPRGMT